MKARVIKIVLLFSLVVLFGYLRDTLFVRIAWHEKVITRGAFPPEPHMFFNFLFDFSLGQLVWARYVFTGVFTTIFFGLSWIMIKWLFNHPNNFRILYLVYAGVIGLALLVFGFGWLTAQQPAVYPLLRYTTGILETPLIVILLFPLLWGTQKFNSVKER